MKILFFGAKGWIASYFIPILKEKGHEIIETDVRADDTSSIANLLDKLHPDRVVSFLGRTHGKENPTIDYLELPGKLTDNLRDNLYAPVTLAILCKERYIHYTYLGTGCIFSEEDPLSKKFTEKDDPNFFGSSYSIVKGFTDRLMKLYASNTLNVRIRMPITDDLSSRNLITKLASYTKICSYPNSMSVLPTLLPYLADMIEKKQIGTIHLVNPGTISHHEILTLYKKIVAPTKTWESISIEEHDHILKSKRSNNQMDTSLLQKLYPDIPNIHTAIYLCMKNIKNITEVTKYL